MPSVIKSNECSLFKFSGNIITYSDIKNIDSKTAQDEEENLQKIRQQITSGIILTKEEQKHFNLELRRYAKVLDKLKINTSETLYMQKQLNEHDEFEGKTHYFQMKK